MSRTRFIDSSSDKHRVRDENKQKLSNFMRDVAPELDGNDYE